MAVVMDVIVAGDIVVVVVMGHKVRRMIIEMRCIVPIAVAAVATVHIPSPMPVTSVGITAVAAVVSVAVM